MKTKQYRAEFTDGSGVTIEGRYFQEALDRAKLISQNKETFISDFNELEDQVQEMPFLRMVKKIFDEGATSQEVKGIEKYGVPMDPMHDYDWLTMAEEELVDCFKYFVAERTRRDKVLTEAISMIRMLAIEHPESEEPFNVIVDHLKKLSKNVN